MSGTTTVHPQSVLVWETSCDRRGCGAVRVFDADEENRAEQWAGAHDVLHLLHGELERVTVEATDLHAGMAVGA